LKPQPRKIRVLVLLTDGFGGIGGIAKFNRDFLSALDIDETISEVVAYPRLMPVNPEKIPPKINYNTSGLGSKAKYIFSVWSSLLFKRNYDLVICGHINLIPVALMAKVATGAPLLLLMHGIDVWKPTSSNLVNYLTKYIDSYISVSRITQEMFVKWTKISTADGFILPNCFEPSLFKPASKNIDLLDKYSLNGKKVIMTCARLSSSARTKGIDIILDHFTELKRDIPNIAYLIVGDGNDRERLEYKTNELKIDSDIIFTGFVPESEKPKYYCLADVYVMPSQAEGFGIVYLEAMACGIPTVGSILDGSREALRDGLLGILIDPNNFTDIKMGIIEALTKSKRRPEGLDYFSYSNFCKRLHSIVKNVTD